MSAPSITTSVYKYRPYAPWMLAGYVILLVLLFVYSASMTPVVVGIAATVLLMIPIYSAIRPKSFFVVRTVDERKLYMDSEKITWDGLAIPVQDVSGLNIYLYAFDNFKHREMVGGIVRTTTTEFGDQNKLNFVFQEKEYDFTFYLGNYTQYRAVLQIVDAWQKAGIDVSVRLAFETSYIQTEIEYYGQ